MQLEIDGLTIEYGDEGQGPPLLMLHGWGCNGGHWQPVAQVLKNTYRIITPDIPGFGQSTEPPATWGTQEYAALIAKFMEALGLKRPFIAGHSNGGRIAIALAARGLCRRLILVDSAGIPPHRSFKYYFKVYSYKLFKKILSLPGLRHKKEAILEKRRQKTGSADYQAASPVMRQILSRVVNENLREQLAQIENPTLLVWGALDTATPLSDGQEMERILTAAGSDCALVVFDRAGHYSFLEERERFIGVVDAFLAPEGRKP